MLKSEHFSEDSMEELSDSLDEFFSENDIDDEDLVDIQYNFRRNEAMVIYLDDDD